VPFFLPKSNTAAAGYHRTTVSRRPAKPPGPARRMRRDSAPLTVASREGDGPFLQAWSTPSNWPSWRAVSRNTTP
jgi:hypothetical protein